MTTGILEDSTAVVSASLLADAAEALRSRAKTGVVFEASGDTLCLHCCRGSIGAGAIAHAESCPFGRSEVLAAKLDAARLGKRLGVIQSEPREDFAPVGGLDGNAGILAPFDRHFELNHPARHIEYTDGRDPAARIALHEEAAAR